MNRQYVRELNDEFNVRSEALESWRIECFRAFVKDFPRDSYTLGLGYGRLVGDELILTTAEKATHVVLTITGRTAG